ncbi:uncharacterized protein LOC105014229 isoform X2 [Esox lucius]|uniref:uncharacterized protein LOC105014229 isoform X2 n=1 Tax=Esox lucius TaxID=8010 RepID=UPI000973459C|nr:uncharacterized protein LOC105014229 isoform X2 [Esox lucius]
MDPTQICRYFLKTQAHSNVSLAVPVRLWMRPIDYAPSALIDAGGLSNALMKGSHINCKSSDGRVMAHEEETFPTLTLVNVSEWALQNPHQGRVLKTLSNSHFARNASPALLSSRSKAQQRDHIKSLEREDLHFPRFNSVDLSPCDKQHKRVKLNTVQMSPLVSCSSTSWSSKFLVMWIPNPQYTPQCHTQKRPKSPHIAVKELILFPSSNTSNMNRKNSKNMGKMVHFQLTPLSQPRCEQAVDPSDLALTKSGTDTDPKTEEEEEPGNFQNQELLTLETGQETQSRTQTSPQPPSVPRSPFLLRTQPVVFHSVREKTQRHTHQENSTFKYKLDSKTGREDIDWDSLRRRTYLWRKPNLPLHCDREKPCSPEAMTITKSCQQWNSIPKATFNHLTGSPLSHGNRLELWDSYCVQASRICARLSQRVHVRWTMFAG